MKLRILKGPEADRVVEPDPMGCTLGRGKDNDLVLLDEGVSRHHCRIVKTAAGWTVEDLGSVNGIRVNGRRVDGSQTLSEGDILAMCEQELRVEFGEQPPAVSTLPKPFREPATHVRLRIEDFADDDMLEALGVDDAFDLTGLYDGIPLTEKSTADQVTRPDVIWLFRRPILDEWAERGDVSISELVTHVVIHELAHHFGWSDEEIAAVDPWWE